MPEVFDWPATDRLSTVVRCPWCGSRYTSMARGPERCRYCHSCFRSFAVATEDGYDVIADAWSPAIAALQAAGELIAVHLGAGFYGICLLSGISALERTCQASPRQAGCTSISSR